jgi:uncharacterized protein (DUF305 family)
MRTGICLILILIGLLMGACSSPLPYDTGEVQPARQASATPLAAQPTPSPSNNAPYDLQVLDTLNQHYRATLELANLAESQAEHRELKEFARQLSRTQQREIEQLRAWRNEWYAGQLAAENSALPGMQNMAMPSADLRNLSGQAFDRQWLAQLIPLYQGTVELARDILNHAEHAELKEWAARLQEQRPREIEQLKIWQKSW